MTAHVVLTVTIRANPDTVPGAVAVTVEGDPNLTPRAVGQLLRAVAVDYERAHGAAVVDTDRLVKVAISELMGD